MRLEHRSGWRAGVAGRRVEAIVLGLTALLLLAMPSAVAEGARATKSRPKKTVRGQVVKVGEILVVSGLRGGEPQLTDEQNKHFLLTGKWRGELLRLGGHKTKVWGQFGAKKLMQQTIEVQRYEIVDSGSGRRPQVGLLLRGEGDKLRLKTKDAMLDVVARPKLRALLLKRVGCKVWIVGELRSGSLRASRFGWLSCNANKSIKPKKKETPR